MKRFDDAQDRVRVAAFHCLALLVKRVLPPAPQYDATDSYFNYMVSSLLLHRDDSNEEVRREAEVALKEVAEYNWKAWEKQVEKAREKQTRKRECEELLRWAREQQEKQKEK